ncbi:hypothetical protein AC249_AIPGENE11857 [Exaiptasia diaphana]|nr:hypothetical protein AC249_AIPGENE11857 [Exaiptasia diaphana]
MVSGNDSGKRQDAISSSNRNGGRNSGRDRALSGPGKPRVKKSVFFEVAPQSRSGAALHEIMDNIGWRSSKTALHYIKLRQVLNRAEAAARLPDLDPTSGNEYRKLNDLAGFSQAFQE